MIAEFDEKLREAIRKIEEARDKDKLCEYPYNRCIRILRELKKLREIPDKLVPKYRDGIQDEYNRGANEMLEEVINDIRKHMREVNADAPD